MGLLTDLLGDGNATSFAPPTGIEFALPHTGPTTVAMNVDRMSYCGALPLSAARTLTEFHVHVTGAGDGSSVIRVGVSRRTSAGTSTGETLTELGSVASATTGVKSLTGLSQALTPGLWDFWALTNGETATPPTVRAATPSPLFPAPLGDATNALLGRNSPVSAASYGAAMPATVPALITSSVAAAPLIAVQLS